MKKLHALALLFLIILTPCCYAQKKEISQAQTIVKSGKNLAQAEQQMRKLLKDSINQKNIKVWVILTEAVRGQYLAGNERMYLRQQQDTAALFKLALKMFGDYQSLDSVDALPDKKGRVHLKYRNSNSAFLNIYRPNLYNGGVYFLRKQNYKEAFSMIDAFLDCQRQPLFENYHYERDTLNRTAAFWTVLCGYQTGDHEMALKYKDLALQDTLHLESCFQYLAEIYKQQGDKPNYEWSLVKGFECNPSSSYFFPRLIDYYNTSNQTERAMTIVNEALQTNDSSELFLFAKSNLLLNQGDYDECIAICDTLIARNDTLADAYYNAGVAYVNKAFLLEKGKVDVKQRIEIRQLYQKALPYMERYRALAPQEKDKWAAALYNIYLKLNMGKQFEEIDQMLR
jgi:tetratricopeptide (TPR) repeat protein